MIRPVSSTLTSPFSSAAARERAARAALYAGGYLGPFGGGVLAVLIPELRHAYGATTAQVTAGITAYLVPYAALQIVSGTLGGRVGVARAIRGAYIAYAIASVAVAMTTSVGAFLIARALQGAANAFTSPLLLAAVAESTPEGELGRAMGTFAAVQTAGVVSAPLVGGFVGAIDYRLAFIIPAAVALLLVAAPLPRGAERGHAEPPRLRSAFTRRSGWTAAAAFTAFMATTGLSFLVALRAGDAFGLGPTERGLLLAVFGAAGVLAGRPAGGLVDRFGAVRLASAGAVVSAVALPFIGFVDSVALLALCWFAAGLGSSLIWAGLNTLMVRSAPANRAGAVSLVGAFKFAGSALAPVLLLPVYEIHEWLAFTVAAVLVVTLVFTSKRAAAP
jgi:MFS family permease